MRNNASRCCWVLMLTLLWTAGVMAQGTPQTAGEDEAAAPEAGAATEKSNQVAWAEGIPVTARLTQPANDGCKLCDLLWSDAFAVSQDRKDNLYVLDLTSGHCDIYSPTGELADSFRPTGWQPLQAAPVFKSFAVNPTGDRFAIASGNKVLQHTRKKVTQTASLPTFITSLAFAGGDLVIAKLPVELSKEYPKGKRVANLLAWLDSNGEISSEALEADPARGPNPMAVAMTQGVGLAAAGDSLWVLDQARFYRVRLLTAGGRVLESWISDRGTAPVSFTGELPEDAAGLAPKGGSFQPVNVPKIEFHAVARDELLWVLVKQGGERVIDLLDRGLAGPLARFQADPGWPANQIAVTEDLIWLFPPDDRGTPKRYQRRQDWEILEEARSSADASTVR